MRFIATKLASTAAVLGLTAIIGVLHSPYAIAQDDTGLYVGGNFGQSRAEIDDHRINLNLLGQGFSSTTIEDDDRSRGFKIFGGYQFNKNFAVEGGYFDLGKFGFSATTIPPGTLDAEIKVKGLNLDLVGILPITERFSAFARAGVNHARSNVAYTTGGLVSVLDMTPKEHDTNYKFGFGLQFDVSDAFGLRAEAERYRINDAVGNKGDIDLFSVGLVYRFGGSAEPERVAERPVVTRPEPEPQRPAEVVRDMDSDNDGVVDRLDRCPNTPAGSRVNANGCPEVLMTLTGVNFAFDSAVIEPESERILDRGVAALTEANSVRIHIEGHTDNIGSDAYNEGLSERRANAVRDYLVSKGISASRLTVDGRGESEPVASNESADGRYQNRRVELHVEE